MKMTEHEKALEELFHIQEVKISQLEGRLRRIAYELTKTDDHHSSRYDFWCALQRLKQITERVAH